MNTPTKFIFIGGGIRGKELLKTLFKQGIKAVKYYILKEDNHEPVKHNLEISNLLEKEECAFKVCKKLQDEDYEFISSDTYDFAIVCGWRTIIKSSVKDNFTHGLIAAHDSLLPDYRGFAPTNWAIINGEKITGVTLFQINFLGVDSGPVLLQEQVVIAPEDDINLVMKNVTNATINLYLEMFRLFPNFKFLEQDEQLATYTCKRAPEDGFIDWKQPHTNVFNLIRALIPPYPGARCIYKDETYIIHSARIGDSSTKKFIGNIPGKVIGIQKNGIEVLCEQGTIFIEKWSKISDNEVVSPSETVKSITHVLR